MHYNNHHNTIEISDRGLAYGDGIFETIAVIDGQLQHWNLHWQRLLKGTERLFLNYPDEKEILHQIDLALIDACSTTKNSMKGVIKIILTRGSGGRGYLFPQQQCETLIVSYHQWPERNADDYLQGVDAVVCKTKLASQPALSGIKHLNRLEQVLARNEFDNVKYQEGIMLSQSDKIQQLVIEGCSSNLFFVLDGTLCTPKIDHSGVLGTMRQAIIDFGLVNPLLSVQQDYYNLQQLEQATEVFFCNSIYGIIPVASISFSPGLKPKQKLQQWFYNDRTISCSLARQFNIQLQRPFDF